MGALPFPSRLFTFLAAASPAGVAISSIRLGYGIGL
jgi:hypothetical protein